MANTELSQQIRQGVDALRYDDGIEPLAGCQAGDLKGLLSAIVDQISEADRRHSDTLAQLQDRMAGIGREAKALKPRVPDSFAAAFERIEAGMAELASRIVEAGDGRATAPSHFDDAYAAPVTAAPAHSPAAAAALDKPSFIDPPAALRSASDSVLAATRRREEEATRTQSGIDTFDVIETSLPGNVSDPWDRDAAEALTGLYESGATGIAAKHQGHIHANPAADLHLLGTVPASHTTSAPMASVDHTWLEARFSEIAKRIDESLVDIRPDQGFFSLGQRVDQLEQHFSSLIDGVATRGDVEGVRLIEAHVSELAGHLENAHQQLMRLDVIEDHLAGIAVRLDDVYRLANEVPSEDMGAFQQPGIDMDAFARTAGEAAAAHVAALPPQKSHEAGEVRDMLWGFIAESRQGEENTVALLDTLQQAMIRLLDRVDHMEISTLQRLESQTAPQNTTHEQFGFEAERARGPVHSAGDPRGPLDAAVAAVASSKSKASSLTRDRGAHELPGPSTATMDATVDQPPLRSPSKSRQDFIADARRAKMRLAAEGEASDTSVVIARPELDVDASANPNKSLPRGGKKVAAAATVAKNAKTGTSPMSALSNLVTPRLRVMGLAALLAMSGWYAVKIFHKPAQDIAATIDPAMTPSGAVDAAAANTAPKTAGKNAKLEAPADKVPPETAGEETNPPAAEGSENPEVPPKADATQLNLQTETHGEIVTGELTSGSISVPLFGVTVDSQKKMTAAEVARARRQQAVAAVSTQLGLAALQNPEALAIPASLHPDTTSADPVAAEGSQTSIAKSAMSQSSALDLPPATVGPLSLRLAAANGDPSAEFEVGARLAEGKGTNQNFKDAAKWYQRSASKGFAQAQYRLGTLYERGLGLKPDAARAADWYKRAAEQGNIKAMHNLAVLSANQLNGSPDYATAAGWFEKAAEHGLSDSQFNLAVLHENGLGVQQDLTTAYKWLALAAKSGDKEAIRRRDILQGKLTGEQLAKAESLVGMWKAKIGDQQVNDPRKAGEAWKANPANGVNG